MIDADFIVAINGPRIRRLRRASGIRVEDVAAYADVPPGMVRWLEGGFRASPLDLGVPELCYIGDAIGAATVDELFVEIPA